MMKKVCSLLTTAVFSCFTTVALAQVTQPPPPKLPPKPEAAKKAEAEKAAKAAKASNKEKSSKETKKK